MHATVAAGGTVLEPGCGTGRILLRHTAFGHPTTGVDESADMLAHPLDLDTV